MTLLATTTHRAAVTAGAAVLALAGATATAPGSSAAPTHHGGRTGTPTTIALPDGFQPEGIAIDRQGTAYLGSRADGDIYAVDLRTGRGETISDGPGTASVGLKVDRRGELLYVSGGDSGTARVVDVDSGDVLADYPLTTGPAFINDVVLTKDAAWFTNSAAPELYRVPLADHGTPAAAGDVETVPLTGDWVQPTGFGANGITQTPDGRALLVVNSTDGTLFRVPTTGRRTGVAQQVDLGGQSLTNGDGMLQQGSRLYVVRNQLNSVVELRLGARARSATSVASYTSDAFDVPTTIARWHGAFYLPNARFSTPPTPTTTYAVTRLRTNGRHSH